MFPFAPLFLLMHLNHVTREPGLIFTRSLLHYFMASSYFEIPKKKNTFDVAMRSFKAECCCN